MSRRSFIRRLPIYAIFVAVMAAMSAYVIGAAWIQSRVFPSYSLAELLLPRAVDVVIFGWLFWVGSSIGSFLNVVAWRMPRGESVNGRSYCPRCKTRLAARDNFPVFGWIALRGRCRTCRLPISSRYPIVEAAVAGCFVLVGIAEVYRFNVPIEGESYSMGPVWAPRLNTPYLLMLFYHAAAISSSFACGLVRFDGEKLPPKLTMFTIATVALPLIILPPLAIVPWPARSNELSEWPRLMDLDVSAVVLHEPIDAIVRILCAIVAAIFFARVLSRGFSPAADMKLDPLGNQTRRMIDLAVILVAASMVTGWQAFPAVVFVAALLACIAQRFTRRLNTKNRPPHDALGHFALAIPFALTLQITFWRQLHQSGFWPSINSPAWLVLTSGLACLTIPIWFNDKARYRQEALTNLANDETPSSESEEDDDDEDDPDDEQRQDTLQTH